jgi:hypothetical protein
VKTKILLAELEQYILVVLRELKELRPKDYEYFHSLFPLLIPNLNSELTKDVRTKVYIHRDEIALEILKHALQNKEFLVFIEGVFSARHYKEANPEFFPTDKKKKENSTLEENPIPEENIIPKVINDFDPSLFQMAKNFGTAMLDSAKTGFKKVTPEQHAERMLICNACEFWDGKARMGMGKCLKCGCTGAKQWLTSSTCPINLWGSLP